jgi:hypothetical protein
MALLARPCVQHGGTEAIRTSLQPAGSRWFGRRAVWTGCARLQRGRWARPTEQWLKQLPWRACGAAIRRCWPTRPRTSSPRPHDGDNRRFRRRPHSTAAKLRGHQRQRRGEDVVIFCLRKQT